MHETGYKIIGVADIHGGVYNPAGLDIPALIDHADEAKTVKGFPGGEIIGGAGNPRA